MKRRIGFIGVGNMGKGICHNVILAGHEVSVFVWTKSAQNGSGGRRIYAVPWKKYVPAVTYCSCPSRTQTQWRK